ncbi:MAG: hypothetical protein ABI977_15345 [Acidobacteriota bacterium]
MSLLLTISAQTRTTPSPARKTFAHPKGFSFQHPADWRAENNDEFTQLLPPGLTAEDQTENYRVLTEASPVEAGDPRFAAELDRLASQLPGFSKAGSAQYYKTKTGNGLRAVWAGKNFTTNQPIQIRMYATTLNGLAIVLFAAGVTTKLDARELVLQEIASSVASATNNQQRTPGQAETSQGSQTVDRSPLAQQWQQRLRGKKLVFMSSYNSGGGGGGMSSKTEILLNQNGTFRVYSESSVSMSVPGANGSSGGTKQAKGTWRIYAQAGKPLLETRYDNGQIETSALEDRNGQTFVNGKRWFVTEQ